MSRRIPEFQKFREKLNNETVQFRVAVVFLAKKCDELSTDCPAESDEVIFCAALLKLARELPQTFNDIVTLILKWRPYQNVHDKNRWSWGYPPSHIDETSSNQYWTWKGTMDNPHAAVSAIWKEIHNGQNN